MATKNPSKNKGKEDAPVNAGTIPFALQRLDRLLGGAAAGNVTITPLKSKTLLSIQSQGAVAEASLSAPVQGLETSWDFPFVQLSAALQNHNTAEFNFDNGQLNIKDKRYSATLQGSENAAVLRVEKPESPTCDIEVTPEIWSLLETMTAKIKISKSLASMPDITVHYLFSKKTAMAVAYDRFQMAAYFAPNTTGTTFSLTLPLAKAESVFKNSVGVTAMQATDALLYVKATGISFSTSLPSVEDTTGVPVEAVIGRVKSLRETNFKNTVLLPKAGILQFLSNSKAIANANALLKITVSSEGTANLELSSEGNKVNTTLKCKSTKNFKLKLDISYVNTIVSKASDSVQLETDGNTLIFREDNLLYASVLSVDDEDTSSSKKSKANDDSED